MTSTETRHPSINSLRQWSAPTLMVVGVIVIPTLLTLLFNSFSAPDAAANVRMAFATVAGQTIAIVTVILLLVSIIIGAGDLLLQRLDLLE
jgi:sterol desaturase/sphingolipid hydroxylase (fatty acid hydroxylase superfamily)